MSSKKKTTKEAEPTNLRRSTRSTRGSIRPVVDLSQLEIEPDLELKEGLEQDEEYTVTSTKRESKARKSNVKLEPKKKEPVKRKQVNKSSVSKQETTEAVKDEEAKLEPTSHDLDDGAELADMDDDGGAHYELSEIELKEINHAFDMNRLSDSEELMNSDGLRTAIRSLGFEPRGDEIKRLLKNYSKKGGKVSRDGFHQIMAFKFGSSPEAKLSNLNDEISRVFNLLDLDKTGMITLENLKSISKELNEDLTEDELNEMIIEADLDGDRKINKQEFENIMKKTSLY